MNGRAVRAAERWLAIWSAQTIVAASLILVVASYAIVALIGHYIVARHHITGGVKAFTFFFLVTFHVLALSVVVGSVATTFFSRRDRLASLRTVLVSYFSLILVFASLFYVSVFFNDYDDAVTKYARYRHDRIKRIDGHFAHELRAFRGIDRRFWSGVDWPVAEIGADGLRPPEYPQRTPAQMRAVAESQSIDDVVQFIPGAAPGIFGDTMYFSVVTITTVGYGDIVPLVPGVRFAAALEAICNALLLIVGLGMILGNWENEPRSGGPE